MIHLRFDTLQPDLPLKIRPLIHHNIFNLLFSDSPFSDLYQQMATNPHLLVWTPLFLDAAASTQDTWTVKGRACLQLPSERFKFRDFFSLYLNFILYVPLFFKFNSHLFRKYCFTWAKLLRKRQTITTLWIFQYFIRIPHMFNPDPKKENISPKIVSIQNAYTVKSLNYQVSSVFNWTQDPGHLFYGNKVSTTRL